MRYALVDNSTHQVVNVVVITEGDGSEVPDGFEAIPSDTANIGDVWNGETFATPA